MAEPELRAKTKKSWERFVRSQQSLAGGVASGLRRSARPYPLFFERGAGSRIWDVDGNEYIDYTLAWGPLMLGHAHPGVAAAIAEQARRGLTFGAQHDLEYEVAEGLLEMLPGMERVVFSNSGTEIVQVALRLARAITGRRRYLKFEGHYHGWSDEVLVSYKPGAGHTDSRAPAPTGLGQLATESAVVAQWNERASVEAAFERTPDGISAILCEPLLANSGCIPPAPGFLEFLRETATRQGALLIFDEVITGFRLAPGGAQEYFGVQADLATYAKALGAGTPLSALAGRREFLDWIADGRVVHAGTLNGNPLCLAAAKVALAELRRPGVYAQLHRLGDQLRAGLVEALGGRAVATGIGPVFQLHFQAEAPRSYRDTWAHDKAAYSDFLVELLDAGVMPLPDGRWYLSLAHTEEDVRETLERAREVGRRYAR